MVMNAMAIPPRTAISMPFIRVPATLMTEDTPAPKTMPMRRGLGMILVRLRRIMSSRLRSKYL